MPDGTLAVCYDVPVLADGTADGNLNRDSAFHSYYRRRHTVSRRCDSRHHRTGGRMRFKFGLVRRGLKFWYRRHEWPFRIAWKRESLRKLVPRRRQLQHRKREWRKVVDA